jgi:hypothetical protein
MIALIRIAIVVMSLLLAAIVGVRTIGAAQKSPLVALFSAPDGSPCEQPCLFGVRPGKTLFSDAVLLLRQHPLLQGFEEFLTVDVSGLQVIQFGGTGSWINIREDQNERVLYVAVELFPPQSVITPISFGDLVLFLGLPDFVNIDNSYPIQIHYRYLLLGTTLPGTTSFMSVNDQILRLYVNATPLEGSERAAPWQGFTTTAHYVLSIKKR